MRKTFTYLVVISAFFSSFFSKSNHLFAQNLVVTEVQNAIIQSNAKMLAKHFQDVVILNMQGDEGSYSSSQAEGIMKGFFNDHKINSFKVPRCFGKVTNPVSSLLHSFQKLF